MPDPIRTTELHSSKKKGFLRSLFDWRMDPSETERQVAEYNTLNWTASYRKIAGALWLLTVVMTAAFGHWMAKMATDEILWSVLIYGALAIFCYRGHRWALIVSMILWTFEKGYSLIMGPGPSASVRLFQVILWWALYMGVFWKALQVERARRRPLVAQPFTDVMLGK